MNVREVISIGSCRERDPCVDVCVTLRLGHWGFEASEASHILGASLVHVW